MKTELEYAEDLKIAISTLKAQAYTAKILKRYYDGDQPLVFTQSRLREVFGRAGARFIQNWCAVVVNAVTDRLVFKGWDATGKQVQKELNTLYKKHRVQKISRKVHLDAVISGDGFVMFDLIDSVQIPFYNSPEQVAVIYSEENPNLVEFGVKVFRSRDNKTVKLNMYYPDTIMKYEGKTNAINEKNMVLLDTIPNPFKKVPIVHFHNDVIDIPNILTLQDAINKTFSDMMVVSEFGAFPLRWIITNADISDLKANPQTFLQIPKGASDEEKSQIGEFGSANTVGYLDTMDKLANSIAVISRTPKHYFMNTGANISGEALRAMEAPLVKKITQIQEELADGWIEFVQMLYAITEEVTCVWSPVETEQMETTSKVMQILKSIGIPLVTILKRFGWGEDEIEQMAADKEIENEASANLASAALVIANKKLEQDNKPF